MSKCRKWTASRRCARSWRELAIPVVMVSSQTEAGAKTTIQALQIGAMDFIPKANGFELLIEKLQAVAMAAPRPRRAGPPFLRPCARLAPRRWRAHAQSEDHRHRRQHRRTARALAGARTPASAVSRADRHRPAHAAAIYRRDGQMALGPLRDQDRRSRRRHGAPARNSLCRPGRHAVSRRQRTAPTSRRARAKASTSRASTFWPKAPPPLMAAPCSRSC